MVLVQKSGIIFTLDGNNQHQGQYCIAGNFLRGIEFGGLAVNLYNCQN